MTDTQLSDAIVELKQSVAKLEEKIEGALKRMDEQKRLTEVVYDLSSSFKLLNERIEHFTTCQGSMRQEIDELRMKPAKRWDGVVEKIILALVTAGVGFLIAQVLGN